MSSIIGPSSGVMRAIKAWDVLRGLQFGVTRLQDGRQRGITHHFGGVRKPFGENTNDLHYLIGMDTELEELLRVGGGRPVGAQMHGRVGIVDAHQPDGPLDALQQFQVDAGRLADLARGHVIAVVTDQLARRHQHRNRRRPDLLSGDALLEQPLDQLGALGTSAALQTVEQLLDLRLIHSANV